MEKKITVLHLLTAGGVGGIESLIKDIAKFSTNKNIFCFVFAGGVIADEMKAEGADTIELNIGNSKHFIRFLKSFRKICVGKEVDIIIIHHPAPLFFVAVRIIYETLRIPYYTYIHSNINHALLMSNTSIRSILFGLAADKASGIICISKSVANSVVQRFQMLKNKITIIYNGVNIEAFKKNASYKATTEQFIILYIGRLIPIKSIDLLLKAIALMSNRRNVSCIIIGDGPERKNLEELSSRLGLVDRTIFMGAQRNISEWLNEADLFVHPATCEEGFGITLVEAMASGLPCIAFNKGAIPEIIEDGKNGYIVDDTTAEALSGAVSQAYETLKKMPEYWNSMRISAAERAEDFTIQNMVNQLDRLLNERGDFV
jgi:glycosyltransferase involved in cell wall biosynthesis